MNIKLISFIFLICVFSSNHAFSQESNMLPGTTDTINKYDERGFKQGLWILTINSNRLFAKINYKDNKKNGYFEEYFQDGINVSSKGYYKDDTIDSTLMIFYPNGTIRAEINYKNGHKNGISKYFNNIGGIEELANYVCDSNDGIFVKFDEEGDTILLRHFSKNICLDCKENEYQLKNIGNGEIYEKNYYYKDKLSSISVYLNNEEIIRRVFRIKKPYNIEKEYYYQNGKTIKCIYYNRKGKMKSESK